LIVRVALIFAAGYVVISVIGLIVGRRWLSQLGPFKASDPVGRLDRGTEALESDLREALDTIQELRQRLVENDDRITEAQAEIGPLLYLLDTMERRDDDATTGQSETRKQPTEDRADT